ncbi:MAG TPA: S8 family serine peptidase [Haliangiales bacterium]|nr:S8 family serine peptidase [Haliangiales bacterium]
MLFLFHKNWSFRTTSTAVAALVVLSTLRSFAEGSSSETVVLYDAGQPRRFEIARNELHFRDPTGAAWVQSVPAEPSVERLRARAASLRAATGAEVKLVIYPAGHPRDEFTRRLLTRRVLVRLTPQFEAASVLTAVSGVAQWQVVDYLPGAVLVEAADPTGALALAESLRVLPGVRSAEAQLARRHQPKLVPNDTLFVFQWYLRNTGQWSGTAGIDLHVTNVWNNYRGSGIVIGIVDDGLQTSHPDLSPNYTAALSYDFDDDDPNPNPTLPYDGHGTSCAGVAAARGNNSTGVCGVAYEAGLAGIRLIAAPTSDDTDASAFLTNNQAIQIKNNSWGPPDDGADLYGIGPLVEAALAAGAQTGRGGRGTLYVFAAGNGLESNDNANHNAYANSIYTIAVGAINDQGMQASYSTPGACVALSAPSIDFVHPGPGVATTDLTSSSGYNTSQTSFDLADKNYTKFFGGTSASAPMVSGVIALILQANNTLGWRDVKEILMRTATQNATTDADWAVNSAGFHFNHKFGAGLVNAEAAVAAALAWTNLPPATNQFVASNGVNLAIPDSSSAGVDLPFAFTNDALRVEHIRLTVDLVHPRRGDLAVTVTSPSGMRSRLFEPHADTNFNFYSWKFSSVHHWGEISSGTWTVNFADKKAGNTGRLISASLELIGTPLNPLTVAAAAFREVDGRSNANGALDPGETVEQSLALRNDGSASLADLNSTLTTTIPGVTLLQPAGSYPVLSAGSVGTNATPFVYRVAKSVPCGTIIPFTVVSTNGSVRLTNHFSQVVGQIGTANPATNSFESADAPKPVPDLTTTLATNTIAAAANRILDDVNVSVRIDHTTIVDLQIALVHPDGTEVLLADHAGGNNPNMGTGACGAGVVRTVFDDEATTPVNSGSAPFAGSFRPANPLSALRGKPLNGVWKLRLSDQYSGDFGTLLCWGLDIVSHEQTVACSVFNPPPTATNLTLATPMNTAAAATLSGGDIDGDPLRFQIVTPPPHGQLIGFDPNAGTFTYQPVLNFAGNDLFTFRDNDGLTNSATATVNITVNATRPVFTGFERLADGRFTLHALAPAGPACVIEATTNLLNWLPIATNPSPANPFDFIDNGAADFPQRFYRIRQ